MKKRPGRMVELRSVPRRWLQRPRAATVLEELGFSRGLMCLCVKVCMYICIYNICIYICIYIYIYVYIYVYIYIYRYTCMYICTYVCACFNPNHPRSRSLAIVDKMPEAGGGGADHPPAIWELLGYCPPTVTVYNRATIKLLIYLYRA